MPQGNLTPFHHTSGSPSHLPPSITAMAGPENIPGLTSAHQASGSLNRSASISTGFDPYNLVPPPPGGSPTRTTPPLDFIPFPSDDINLDNWHNTDQSAMAARVQTQNAAAIDPAQNLLDGFYGGSQDQSTMTRTVPDPGNPLGLQSIEDFLKETAHAPEAYSKSANGSLPAPTTTPATY